MQEEVQATVAGEDATGWPQYEFLISFSLNDDIFLWEDAGAATTFIVRPAQDFWNKNNSTTPCLVSSILGTVAS